MWVYQEQVDGNFDIPLSDQAVVDMEAEDWAAQWQETARYTPPNPTQATPLLEEGIKRAAHSCPANTGLGADNIAPRAIARLSDKRNLGIRHLLQANCRLNHIDILRYLCEGKRSVAPSHGCGAAVVTVGGAAV